MVDELRKIEAGAPKEQYGRLTCSECGPNKRHEVLTEVRAHWSDERGLVDLWVDHQIVQCPACQRISYCEISRFSEDWDHDPDTGEAFIPPTIKQYPGEDPIPEPFDGSDQIPQLVLRAYEETRIAFLRGLPVLCGLGLRTVIEAVALDRKINGGSLYDRIQKMFGTGLITKADSEYLHSLRFIGNSAAHEITPHGEGELKSALKIVEHLLRGIYVLPQIAANLPTKERNAAPDPKDAR